MRFKRIKASKNSYGARRNRKDVKFIVIHYTGNTGDTAVGNGLYFKNTNKRSAGAHWFVDQKGVVVRSVPMNRIAWSVGGFFTQENGAGKYYLTCNNSNSVSIELCDNTTKDPNSIQTARVKELISYIRRKCPNAKTIIRHWDVNGKECPKRMIGSKNSKWKNFKRAIGG